jgi:cation diffusion facilitator family transporter
MKRDNKQAKISSEKVVITSFIVDVSDILVNAFVAVISGSVIMLSQALEGAADLLASGFLLVGVKKAKRPSDKKHPFGYGRELYFWTFLSALAIFVVTSSLSFYLGLRRLLNPEPISNLSLAYVALIFAIFTNGYSANLSLKRLLGKKSLSSLLKTFSHSAFIETKTTLILDVMGTCASILGLFALILFGQTGNLRYDGLGAMAIGLTLAILAFFIIKGARDLLVGQSASDEIEDKIKKATLSFPNVKKILDLRTLQIGANRLLVNIEVHLADKLTTSEIELLIDKIETQIKKEVPEATNIQIELETPDV